MSRNPIRILIRTLALALLLGATAFATGPAAADVTVDAKLCNQTQQPVNFEFFHHNDMASGAVPFSTKAVRACSCVDLQLNTDLWHNFPPAKIRQLVYRDVESISGAKIKVCVDAKGKFEGYIEVGVQTCAEASKETNFLPAPELTGAQGDLPILQSRLHPSSTSCQSKDALGGCTRYSANYTYQDGSPCFGN